MIGLKKVPKQSVILLKMLLLPCFLSLSLWFAKHKIHFILPDKSKKSCKGKQCFFLLCSAKHTLARCAKMCVALSSSSAYTTAVYLNWLQAWTKDVGIFNNAWNKKVSCLLLAFSSYHHHQQHNACTHTTTLVYL